jgi:hypothetical protein
VSKEGGRQEDKERDLWPISRCPDPAGIPGERSHCDAVLAEVTIQRNQDEMFLISQLLDNACCSQKGRLYHILALPLNSWVTAYPDPQVQESQPPRVLLN